MNASMPYLVKCTEEYKPAMPGGIYLGIQACNTWSNLLRNTSMQYLVKFAKENKPAIAGLIN